MAELFSLRCILGVGLCFAKNTPANCKMISKTFKQSYGEEQVLNFFCAGFILQWVNTWKTDLNQQSILNKWMENHTTMWMFFIKDGNVSKLQNDVIDYNIPFVCVKRHN